MNILIGQDQVKGYRARFYILISKDGNRGHREIGDVGVVLGWRLSPADKPIRASNRNDGLARLSVGVENIKDLIAGLDQALKVSSTAVIGGK